jgi:hypothetical protein
MEPEGSLPCSQELSTGPYPKPDRSNIQCPICIPLLTHSCYMPRPSHPSWLDHSNYTWRRVHVMKLFIMSLFGPNILLSTQFLCRYCLFYTDNNWYAFSHTDRFTDRIWCWPADRLPGNVKENVLWLNFVSMKLKAGRVRGFHWTRKLLLVGTALRDYGSFNDAISRLHRSFIW